MLPSNDFGMLDCEAVPAAFSAAGLLEQVGCLSRTSIGFVTEAQRNNGAKDGGFGG